MKNIKYHKKLPFNFLIIFLVLVIILGIVLFFYTDIDKDKQGDDKDNAVNFEKEVDDLKDINNDNIVKAQSYKAQELRNIDDSDIYKGDLNNPVQIIVYEDYSDAFSADYSKNLNKVLSEYSDDVVIAYRPYIVDRKSLSNLSSKAVFCAKKQNRFFEFREAMFSKLNNSNLYQQDINTIASDLDLNIDTFGKCLKNNELEAEIKSISLEANEFGVFGAPTTFINNELVIGNRSWEDMVDSNNEQVEGLKTIINNHLNNYQ